MSLVCCLAPLPLSAKPRIFLLQSKYFDIIYVPVAAIEARRAAKADYEQLMKLESSIGVFLVFICYIRIIIPVFIIFI